MSSVTFSTTVGGDGSTVTDDDNATTGLRNGGWRTRFVPALTQEVAVAANAVASATSALASKNSAASSSTEASSSASTAATQATNSANSATASASSATASASSATSAAASATSANNSVAAISTAFSSPTPIGNVVANTGAFTNLSYTGTLTGSTGILNIGSGQLYKDALGRVGIGSTALTAVGVYIAQTTTASSAYGILNSQTASAATTASLRGFQSSINTAASAFTLGSLSHYYATQGSFGAGSSVSYQIGFDVNGSLTGATNNYAFTGNIAAGTGRYNLYMSGTADNYLGGSTTISVTDNTNAALRITQTGTGNALVVEDSANPDSTPFVIDASGNVFKGATTSQTVVIPSGTQINGTGTDAYLQLGRWSANAANPGLIYGKSRGTSVGTRGLVASGDNLGEITFSGDDGASFIVAAIIQATVDGTPGTNDMPGRLVFSTTADGASSPTERMRIDNAGRVGIGQVAPSAVPGATLYLNKSITGGVVGVGATVSTSILSDVTAVGRGFATDIGVENAVFTLPSLQHFFATQGTKGASATLTDQFGFYANSTLTGATNNYGFYGNLAAGTGRYNLYMNGTADNYLAGSLGIGGVPSNQNSLTLAGTFKGSAGYSFPLEIVGTIDPTVASSAAYTFFGRPSVAAGTLPDLRYFAASQGVFTGTVTTQYGVMINASIIGATNNYAFYGAIPAGTGRYNLYMAGTANNYLGGPLITAGLKATSAAAPTIASATTIAPTTQIAFISGTTAIATITAPIPISLGGGQITLIPTGIFTTTTAGNIALASTAVVGKALIMTYDATTTKWYPSY